VFVTPSANDVSPFRLATPEKDENQHSALPFVPGYDGMINPAPVTRLETSSHFW